MKTMTCRALGGPCDLEHHGASADDVIKAQDQHLKEAELADDTTHQQARDAIPFQGSQSVPLAAWFRP